MVMPRTMISALSAVLIAGCGTLNTLEDRAEAAFDTGVNPEQREIHYLRDGNQVHYFRRECAGRFCDAVAD